ncbi:MAG: GNAT family N-acetyltransferase [Chloroflexota bacterium]|nr:GNAT family N-acetyltransferase [Chloroflexota bacterium]
MAEADEGRPVVNIQGELVALGPLRRDLVPLYHRWDNDLLTSRNRGTSLRPVTFEEAMAGYERVASDSASSAWFTLYELSTWRPIGLTWWDEINYRDRTAAYSIFIGETETRGKGYGTEATRLMLDYAFTVLGLHNVMLITAEFNTGGLRAYKKAGFREFGRRRQSYPVGGKLWDDIYMECLATEFESSVLARTFAPAEPG